MDTRYWLAENQIKNLFNGRTIEQAREDFEAVKWARNWWYPVAKLPLTDSIVAQAIANSLAHPEINTETWVPMAEVMQYWPYSRQRFFQVVESGAIERQNVTLSKSEFWVYNKADIVKYIQVHAVEGRLKKAVEDIEGLMAAVENW